MTAITRSIPFLLTFVAAALVTPISAIAHIEIDSPDGGEVLVVGTTHTITWHIVITHALENWDLSYSTTGIDGPWIPIATDLPPGDPAVGSIHTYEWTIPDDLSDQVRVRVFMDNEGDDEDIWEGSEANVFIVEEITEPTFVRGDCNGDGTLGLADVITSLQFQFSDGLAPACLSACDLSDDGSLGLQDAILELSFLFVSGLEPPAPFPTCGWDPTPGGSLDCLQSNIGCP